MYTNSGWHHRHFVIAHSTQGWSEEVVEAEISFTMDKIRRAPTNESAWNYLMGYAGSPLSM